MTPGRDLFGEVDYRGVKGKRVRVSLRFIGMKTMPENTRNAYLYKFKDAESNLFNWFTNSFQTLVIGRWYSLNAIVGKPKRFRGNVETRLKDVRIAARR
jgi:hypothetical protein